jgi:mono/diheme cytochrome c family protein
MRLAPLLTLACDPAARPSPAAASKAILKRGAYLVGIMGCHECHTPLKMGPKGPEPVDPANASRP